MPFFELESPSQQSHEQVVGSPMTGIVFGGQVNAIHFL